MLFMLPFHRLSLSLLSKSVAIILKQAPHQTKQACLFFSPFALHCLHLEKTSQSRANQRASSRSPLQFSQALVQLSTTRSFSQLQNPFISTSFNRILMADEGETKKRRGRPAKAAVVEAPVVERKAEKRARPAAAPKEDKGEGAPASKRGRGRPKGSAKRKGKGKAKAPAGGRGRGRPKKPAAAADEAEDKEQSSEADEAEGAASD